MPDLLMLARRLHLGTIAWAAFLGMLAGFGAFPLLFPGFAHEDALLQTDVRLTQAEDANKQLREVQLSDSILQLKDKECSLPKDAPKNVYAQTIIKAAQEYQRLAGVPYAVPACDDL